MKKIYLCLFILLYSIAQVCGQETLSLQKELTEGDLKLKLSTVRQIADKNMVEYIPYLEENIFKQTVPVLMYRYLDALNKLGSENIVDIALAFLPYTDNFGTQFPSNDPLERKVDATRILFQHQNYSTVNYIFELIDREKPKAPLGIETDLDFIIKNIPEYSEQAESELYYFVNNGIDELNRSLSFYYLWENFGKKYQDLYLQKFVSDNSIHIRLSSLDYLFKVNYSNLKPLLYERLSLDPDPNVRLIIADSIFKVFGTPADVKHIKDYVVNEPENITKNLINMYGKTFIPPVPNIPTHEMIDSLDSYTDQLYQFGWIKAESNYKQYKAKTQNLRGLFQQNKIQDVCTNLNWIISNAQSQQGSTSLTQDGYKFLFYYTGYIKEKVEKEFGVCK